MSNRQILFLLIVFEFLCWAVILYGIHWLIWG